MQLFAYWSFDFAILLSMLTLFVGLGALLNLSTSPLADPGNDGPQLRRLYGLSEGWGFRLMLLALIPFGLLSLLTAIDLFFKPDLFALSGGYTIALVLLAICISTFFVTMRRIYQVAMADAHHRKHHTGRIGSSIQC